MPDSKPIKTKREAVSERLRAKYPEAQFDDDEQLFGQISDDYDQFDEKLSTLTSENERYKKQEGDLGNFFASNPRAAGFLTRWKNGDDPVVVLMQMYGDDIKDAIDDPERQEAIASANKEYLERVTQEKQYETEYTANLSQSLEHLEAIQKEEGLSDDQLDAAMEWLLMIIKDGIQGKFTPETIRMAIKAQNYDTAVAEADHAGEVRGKNARAEEKLRKPNRGDGTPHLEGKNGGGATRRMPDLGAIDRYGDGTMNIFERGGEKRTPIRR